MIVEPVPEAAEPPTPALGLEPTPEFASAPMPASALRSAAPAATATLVQPDLHGLGALKLRPSSTIAVAPTATCHGRRPLRTSASQRDSWSRGSALSRVTLLTRSWAAGAGDNGADSADSTGSSVLTRTGVAGSKAPTVAGASSAAASSGPSTSASSSPLNGRRRMASGPRSEGSPPPSSPESSSASTGPR